MLAFNQIQAKAQNQLWNIEVSIFWCCWCRCITVSAVNGRNCPRCPEPSPSSTVSSSALTDTEIRGVLHSCAHTQINHPHANDAVVFIDCLKVVKAVHGFLHFHRFFLSLQKLKQMMRFLPWRMCIEGSTFFFVNPILLHKGILHCHIKSVFPLNKNAQ